jgi:hypothetical protein
VPVVNDEVGIHDDVPRADAQYVNLAAGLVRRGVKASRAE